MKTDRNILVAFILNLMFSLFEFFGGIFTGSVAILSDAVHDLGDAASIGVSWFLERKSKRQPDAAYTYGYGRYSVVGGLITSLILLFGSVVMIGKAISGILSPPQIDYDGMILFAVVGVVVNFLAAYATHRGDSLNQKAVNLHMLEDVLGWAVVLIGAIVMRFTDFAHLDPILSIGVSVYILYHAVRTLGELLEIFLEKAPHALSLAELLERVAEVDGVVDVHHIHLWSMDGNRHYATMHIVTDADPHAIKDQVRQELRHHGIVHATLELESTGEHCHERECYVHTDGASGHCHHHHHH
ncbi:MAG: cation transporter [Ruminococcaceae bacterium]|nr:cation transporter [Oscillospiraceae bacterium]